MKSSTFNLNHCLMIFLLCLSLNLSLVQSHPIKNQDLISRSSRPHSYRHSQEIANEEAGSDDSALLEIDGLLSGLDTSTDFLGIKGYSGERYARPPPFRRGIQDLKVERV